MGNPGENVGRRFVVLERRDGRREQEEKKSHDLGGFADWRTIIACWLIARSTPTVATRSGSLGSRRGANR